ncbi:MAG: hypothetical protein ACRDFX_13475, partial [Chloroflexota bacterium]
MQDKDPVRDTDHGRGEPEANAARASKLVWWTLALTTAGSVAYVLLAFSSDAASPGFGAIWAILALLAFAMSGRSANRADFGSAVAWALIGVALTFILLLLGLAMVH